MRRGFTLLEVLFAVALLSVIVIAAVTWSRLAARGLAAVRTAEAAATAEEAALALVRDDLRLAAAVAIDEAGALQVATLHGLDERPGRRLVRWTLTEDGVLTRSEALAAAAGEERPVLFGLAPGRFHREEDGAIWWLRDLAADEPPEAAAERRLVWGGTW